MVTPPVEPWRWHVLPMGLNCAQEEWLNGVVTSPAGHGNVLSPLVMGAALLIGAAWAIDMCSSDDDESEAVEIMQSLAEREVIEAEPLKKAKGKPPGRPLKNQRILWPQGRIQFYSGNGYPLNPPKFATVTAKSRFESDTGKVYNSLNALKRKETGYFRMRFHYVSGVYVGLANEEVKKLLGHGPWPQKHCSTSMPKLDDETKDDETKDDETEDNSEWSRIPNSPGWLWEGADDEAVTLQKLEELYASDEDDSRYDDESKEEATVAREWLLNRRYSQLVPYDEMAECLASGKPKDEWGTVITPGTHFKSGTPKAQTCYSYQPNPESGEAWCELPKKQRQKIRRKIKKYHREDERDGLEWQVHCVKDRPPNARQYSLYNGVSKENLHRERGVTYFNIPYNYDLMMGYFVIYVDNGEIVRWVPPEEDGGKWSKYPPELVLDPDTYEQTEANIVER